MNGTGLLEIRDVSKRFGGLLAIDGCSFDVAAGSITGLIGPNGAGKSTLFNVVTGFLAPDAGTIRFERREIQGLAADRIARLGLRRSFQIPRELKRLTVLENLMLVPENQTGERLASIVWFARRMAEEERASEAKALEVLADTGLAEKSGSLAGSLSGGQKKLLELARCSMSRPRLMLLDEPTAGVNPTLIRHLTEAIERMRVQGATILIIEHNMEVAMTLCEIIVVLDRGRVIAQGTPAEIRRDPRVLDAYLGGSA